MINVAYFSNQFASVDGHGIARYAHHLYDSLNDPRQDINLFPVAGSSSCTKVELNELKQRTNLQMLPLGSKFFPLVWKYFDLPQIEQLIRNEVDIVHVLSLGYPIPTRKPFVVTIHDIGPLTHPQFFTKKDQWLMKDSLKQAFDKSSAMICVSQATADAVEKYSLKKYNSSVLDRLHVIHEGVSQEFFELENIENIPDYDKVSSLLSKPFILTVGKISPRKNIQTVLESFSRLKNELPDYQIITVGGDGWDFKNIKSKTVDYGIQDSVHFLGYVSDELLRFLYRQASLFVYPSLFEGFGLTVLEAMACGCPVITSNTTSLPEVAGDAAVLIDPSNVDELCKQMLFLCKNDDLRNQYIEKGLKRAKYFTWEKAASQTNKVYQSIL